MTDTDIIPYDDADSEDWPPDTPAPIPDLPEPTAEISLDDRLAGLQEQAMAGIRSTNDAVTKLAGETENLAASVSVLVLAVQTLLKHMKPTEENGGEA